LTNLLDLPEFNRQVHAAVWGPDASFLVLEGTGVTGNATQAWVKSMALSPPRRLWEIESSCDAQQVSELCCDVAGAIFVFRPKADQPMVRCEAISGRRIEHIADGCVALNSAADLFCCRYSDGAFTVHALRDERLLLRISQVETKRTSVLNVLSRDGRLLAWGNQDGTVSVCDLSEMQRRLGQIRLGWSGRGSGTNHHALAPAR
jgi:hypothetical protein